MQGIGTILKKERESKKITLEQVEEATKIRRKYLEAIENERFEVLPGEVYVKGFVAAYLKYLGIKDRADVAEILKPKPAPVDISEQIAAAEQVHEEQVSRKLQRSDKKNKKKEVFEEPPLTKNTKMILFISIAAILVLFVLQGIYSAGQPNPNDDTQQNIAGEQQGEAANQEGTDVPIEPSVPEEPVYDGLEMTLEILNLDPNKKEKCWMKVTVDGTAAEYNLTEGQIQQVHAAQQIDLHLGNAGVVKVTLNGVELGTLGAQGKVVKESFKVDELSAYMPMGGNITESVAENGNM
ncbi:MAG: helix-turn-helix domain-containing protein [Peptococcaceae bacterium]|nr:helix-turn-helix domain-containing protein [Peptococcaceae bacterium]